MGNPVCLKCVCKENGLNSSVEGPGGERNGRVRENSVLLVCRWPGINTSGFGD